MDYSKYRQANPSNTTSQIIAEINSIRRIKYTRSTSPTSAAWIWGLLGRKISQAKDVLSLHGSFLLTVPTHWTPAKTKAVDRAFAQGIPNSPMKASMLAYLLTTELDPSDIDRYYTQLNEAQRASIVVHSAVEFLEENEIHRLYEALTADILQGEIVDTCSPLYIPIPPAARFRAAPAIIPRLLKPGVYKPAKGTCYSREDIFEGANEDTNLMRKYVGSAHVNAMGHPTPMQHTLSPWMKPYSIEQWPQEHHARQGPQVPTPRRTRFASKHFPLQPQAPYVSKPTQTTVLIHAPAPTQRVKASQQDDTNPPGIPSTEDFPTPNSQDPTPREPESFTSTLLDTDFSYVWSEENSYRQEEKAHTPSYTTQSEPLDEGQELEYKDSSHTQTNTTQSEPVHNGYDQEDKAAPTTEHGVANNIGE